MDDTIIQFARLWGQKEAMGMCYTSTLKEQEIADMCKGYDSLDLQTLLSTWSDEFNYTEWAEDEDEQFDTVLFFEKKIEELYTANYPSREDNINIEEVASAIEEILQDSEFDNIQDSTGYYIIKEDKEKNLSRSIDVSKSTGEGTQPPHYTIFVSYEDEQSDWVYTESLLREELVNTLSKIAAEEWAK